MANHKCARYPECDAAEIRTLRLALAAAEANEEKLHETNEQVALQLVDAEDDRDDLAEMYQAAANRLDAAYAVIDLDNAVCLCGCPGSEHESVDEGAEQCEHEDHECIRVAPAVLEIVGRVRLALETATRERDEWRRHAEEQLADVLRLRFLGIEFASQYGDRALACKYDNSCDDSGREPACIPCAFRHALGLMGVN